MSDTSGVGLTVRMYDFLSPEWIDTATVIHTKYREQGPTIPVAVRINLTVTHVPHGDDQAVLVSIDTTEGDMAFAPGHLDDADTAVVTDYEVARAIVFGAEPAAFMQAFLEGRVKVQGDMTRLLVLQANMPTGQIAEAIAADLAAITN